MKKYVKFSNTSDEIKKLYLQLLKTKTVQQITVKEICDRLQINRSTFYRHYEDIYYLFRDIEDDFIYRLKDVYGSVAQANLNSVDTMKTLLSFIKENKEVYSLLMVYQRDDSLLEKYNELTSDIFLYKIYQKYPNSINVNADHLKQTILFVSSGFFMIYKEWLKQGCVQPIDELANKLSLLSDGCIEATLKQQN